MSKMSLLKKLVEYFAGMPDNDILYDKIFSDICGYSDLKKDFVKALCAVGILLCGPPGSGKSEFLKQLKNHFEEE